MHRTHKKRKIGRLLLLFLLVIAALVILFWRIRVWDTKRSEAEVAAQLAELQEQEEGEGLTYYNGSWYAEKENIETFLVLGLDEFSDDSSAGEGYRNTQQSDFLLLLIFDDDTETFCALHINRDTMTEIQILGVTGDPAGTTTAQIALAHTYGDGYEESCENTVTAVETLLYGVEVDHYMSVTMDAVAIINDLVGGVTVTVLDDFTGIDDTLVEGETVTLTGEHALTYIRTRLGLEDSTNLHRMERQEQYLTALLEQMQTAVAADSEFSLDTLLEIADYMVSDSTVNRLSEIFNTLGLYTYEGYYTLEGEAVEGEEYMEYYLDDTALQDLVIELFYEESDYEETD